MWSTRKRKNIKNIRQRSEQNQQTQPKPKHKPS